MGLITVSEDARNRRTVLRVGAMMLTLTAALLQGTLFGEGIRSNVSYFLDFRAFYCSAVVAVHADPYRAEPLGTCERATVPSKPLHESGFVVPAPLPGWVDLTLRPLAHLPFLAAARIWWFALVLSFAVHQLLVWRLFPRLNPLIAFALLLPLGVWIPTPIGQIVPLGVVLLLGAALAIRSGNDRRAAVLAALATIEPHIGLPVCLALFVARPMTRVPLALSAAALGALSVIAIGPAGVVEYVRAVLPAHIASEAAFRDQYSATYLAISLHVARGAAIAIGQASYWLLAIAAAFLARSCAKADRALLILLPMAFSVIGGPYLHVEHLLAAMPLALYAAIRWPAALVAAVLIAWPLRALLELGGVVREVSLALPPVFAHASSLLAEVPWAIILADQHGSMIDVVTKIPTWAALVTISILAILPAVRHDGRRTENALNR